MQRANVGYGRSPLGSAVELRGRGESADTGEPFQPPQRLYLVSARHRSHRWRAELFPENSERKSVGVVVAGCS